MSSQPTQPAQQALLALAALWRRERQAARDKERAQRLQWSLSERVERGIALRKLVVDESDAALGGRVLLWLVPRIKDELEGVRLHAGEPVRLWAKDPEGGDVQQAIVSRIAGGRIGVVVPGDYAEFLDHGELNLDREAPEVSFDRGDRALSLLRDARAGSHAAKWRELLFGLQEPVVPEAPATFSAFDAGLNAIQLRAVGLALAAQDVALVHGPPGTGKTRTLVEIVRQAVARGERVLVTAASNTAVDNLAERLIDAGVPVLRLGHPARVSAAVTASTLDARLDESDSRKLAKRWTAEANDLRARVAKRRARGNLDHREARELLAESKRLLREARGQLEVARTWIFSQAKVVCATAAGADGSLLAELAFDRVVLDEATQAVDPIALAAIIQAPRLVLAGDPCQLPPTVIDVEAGREGLARTIFERLAERHSASILALLQVQYRMHETLMRFPSDSMYQGKLIAAEEVRARQLTDLPGVSDDPLRPSPLTFLDTAGKGYGEERAIDDPSTRNPGQAERVAVEVRRILARGLPASDCAVITPYEAQARLLRELLRDARAAGLEIGTVDGFQGREKEAIVLDLVRSNDDGELGFLRDARRMNVALTRAKRFLLVVGDSATLQHGEYYERFMDAAEGVSAVRSAWEDDGT